MKELACKDFGHDCDFKASAKTEEELMQQVAKHATEVHQMEVTPELVTQAKSLIKEV
jgi:predicted small metal-binding protein